MTTVSRCRTGKECWRARICSGRGLLPGSTRESRRRRLELNLLAFIFVSWSDPKVESVFVKKIRASSDVLECHHVTGPWNYLLKVRVGTTRDLERFLAETVKTVSGVERTETVIVVSSAKETWKFSLPDMQK
jgi:Lrp/AsnC family leucine-responsive transcriptional regulator